MIMGKSVLCCFKKLGFNNTCIRNTIKKLSKSSMECSFCIWLARNNKHWNPAANCKLNDPSKETCNSPSSLSSPKQTNKSVSNTKSVRPVGFINKGNTCYANSILQILSVVPNLWSRVPSESNALSPMLQAIRLNMAVKKNSTKPVDPSNFLWALKRKLSIIRGVPFDFNTQQDVAEILQVVLDEVKGISLAASHLICNTQKITVSCNTCFCSSVTEENLDIVTLPVSTDIQTSMNQFLKPEILSSQNKWFCPSCNLLSESTRGTCIINSAPILIIQLCRFSNQGGQLAKNENFFSCTQSESNKDLTVPITIEDEVSFTNKCSLIATINHSGTLNRGHYWAFIKDLHSSSWYSSMASLFLMLKKILSTVLHLTSLFTGKFKFFQDLPKIVIVLQGGFVISDIVFGCDDPTYNPSPVRELSLLTQFSGITTLQSLVSEKQCKGA